MIGNRRKSRELALQVLFQAEFVKDINLVDRLDYFRNAFAIEDEVLGYGREVLIRYQEKQGEVDGALRKYSTNWSLERMSKVDLCILRIAATELLPPALAPGKVILNEAIELAKKYGNTESAAFVNGILDEILKG